MFRSLRGWMSSYNPTPNPYGLTTEQVDALAKLVKSPEWRLYLHVLDLHIETLGEQLLTGDEANLLEMRGVIKGYREAVHIVNNILQAKEYQDAREREQRRIDESRAAKRDFVSRFTPFS